MYGQIRRVVIGETNVCARERRKSEGRAKEERRMDGWMDGWMDTHDHRKAREKVRNKSSAPHASGGLHSYDDDNKYNIIVLYKL